MQSPQAQPSEDTRDATGMPPGPSEAIPQAYQLLLEDSSALKTLIELREQFGEILHIPSDTDSPVFLLSGADDAHDVLSRNPSEIDRFPQRPPIGKPDNKNAGPRHPKQVLSPVLTPETLSTYVNNWIRNIHSVTSAWRPHQTIDLLDEARNIALLNMGVSFFNADLTPDLQMIKDAARAIQTASGPPMPKKHNEDSAASSDDKEKAPPQRSVSDVLLQLIADKRTSGVYGDDFLSHMLFAVDTTDDSGAPGITDREVFIHMITLMSAAWGPVAVVLSWALYLIDQHPEVNARLLAEIDSISPDRDLTAHDMAGLPYSDKVVKEVLRMYGPSWMIRRKSLIPLTLQGYEIPAGSLLLISPYVIHRDPTYFPDPSSFHPDRWTPEMTQQLPPGAYLPFADGHFGCVGREFAILELRCALVTILRRWKLTLHPGQDTRPAKENRSLIPQSPFNFDVDPR